MMAIVSVGYDGTVDETQWAHLVGKAGSSEYGVDLAGDFAVTPVAGQDRTVRVAPGRAWGHGVLDVMDVEQTLQFALPASGDRYDMIVLRRDWQPPGGSTTLAIVQGSASSINIPARNTGALGVLDDQPIALVRVSAGSTSVSVTADLRVWARNGGATAKHTHALQYLGALGATVEINGVMWVRRNGNSGPEWRDMAKALDTGWTDLTLSSGYVADGSAPAVSIRGGVAYFKGSIRRSAGPFPQYDIIVASVPSAARHDLPSKGFLVPGNGDNQRKVTINSSGVVSVIAGLDSPVYVSLDQVYYPL